MYATPERDPYHASPSAAGGTPHHHRYPPASPARMEQSPRYAPGYAHACERSPYGAGGARMEGTPYNSRDGRQEQSHLEEEVARLPARLAESAAQSASQTEAISGLVDEVQQLRCASSSSEPRLVADVAHTGLIVFWAGAMYLFEVAL